MPAKAQRQNKNHLTLRDELLIAALNAEARTRNETWGQWVRGTGKSWSDWAKNLATSAIAPASLIGQTAKKAAVTTAVALAAGPASPVAVSTALVVYQGKVRAYLSYVSEVFQDQVVDVTKGDIIDWTWGKIEEWFVGKLPENQQVATVKTAEQSGGADFDAAEALDRIKNNMSELLLVAKQLRQADPLKFSYCDDAYHLALSYYKAKSLQQTVKTDVTNMKKFFEELEKLADGLKIAQMEQDIKGAVTSTVKRQDISHYDHYFFSPNRLGACSEQYCYGKAT